MGGFCGATVNLVTTWDSDSRGPSSILGSIMGRGPKGPAIPLAQWNSWISSFGS